MLSSAPWEPEQSGSQKNREGSGAGAKKFKIWGAGAEAEPKKCRLPDNPGRDRASVTEKNSKKCNQMVILAPFFHKNL